MTTKAPLGKTTKKPAPTKSLAKPPTVGRKPKVTKVRYRRRRKISRPQRAFKTALVKAGLKGFLTEYPVGFYHLDEARPDIKLAIEVDGCFWHGCQECGFQLKPDAARKDKSRNTYLTNRGWTVVRIWEHDIRADLAACVTRIRNTISVLTGRTP